MTTTTAKPSKPSRTERTERSVVIHTQLDQAAAMINAAHATVLERVIEAKVWNIHRDVDGFSGLRDWLVAAFDFHTRTAADLAAIARCAAKFTVLAETATTGAARIDSIAAATRRLDKTKALRVYAKAPYREPVASPFDTSVSCPTPEHLIAQYCQHATVKEVHAHLDELEAALDSGEELIDGLGQESLQRLDLIETETGMWVLDGLLSADTGAMFAKLLTTALPPPRQDETDQDSVLPPAANRRAEALHQMLTVYAADPRAPKRHGQTCTLNLTVDAETLAGNDTGRGATLEGKPVSLAKARLLACEAEVIPSVFDYSTGEAIELGRALRLPNTALRRKLELEQAGGCAWTGCGRPVQWTEAHHIQHWADGGATVAENLVLLCRFHHGRIHTPGWSITKTSPGTALITHHDHHTEDATDPEQQCGCTDYRTDTDLDLEFRGDVANVFPTGLYPEEWSEALTPELEAAAEHAERQQLEAEINAAKAQVRARFTAPTAPVPEPASGPPPCLSCPLRATAAGKGAP
ncbi:MAG TPA: DUF222 domain-containing protein [Glycomyces sp.]|nr:DUF222 domain-containing protein [Glycomyces sp.]